MTCVWTLELCEADGLELMGWYAVGGSNVLEEIDGRVIALQSAVLFTMN